MECWQDKNMLNLEGFVGDSDGLYEIGKPKARGPLTGTGGGGVSADAYVYSHHVPWSLYLPECRLENQYNSCKINEALLLETPVSEQRTTLNATCDRNTLLVCIDSVAFLHTLRHESKGILYSIETFMSMCSSEFFTDYCLISIFFGMKTPSLYLSLIRSLFWCTFSRDFTRFWTFLRF